MFEILLDIVLFVSLAVAIIGGISGAIRKDKKTIRTAWVALLIWLFCTCISALIHSAN